MKSIKEKAEEYLEEEKDEIVCVYDRYAGFVDGANWMKQQMITKWQEIPKDKHGFFDEESDLYERLPIVLAEQYDDGTLFLHYIDTDNWHETLSDLSRQRFRYYIEVECIDNKLKKGE